MKTISKLLAILVCVGLLLSLGACQETPAPGTSGATAAPTQPSETEKPTDPKPSTDTVITTEAESYTVVEGDTVAINAAFTSSGMGISLSYTSADESIATVSKYGKIKGVSAGTTEITIESSDGVVKTVSVTVQDKVFEHVVNAAIHVMYNDATLGCYNTEIGASVAITGDGQYTVTFDCANLSEATTVLGVNSLSNLTSIYIKDADVTSGALLKSNVASCDIRWDSIVVDGVELTITNTEFKTGMRGTIFDSTDPVNAWEGSCVQEVIWNEADHVVSFAQENAQTITITFTVSNLVWNE